MNINTQMAAKTIRAAKPIAKRYSAPGVGVVSKASKVVKTSMLGMAAVVGAGIAGARAIRNASKAANTEIDSQHSPARNTAHRNQILAIRAQGKRRQAAKKLRSARPITKKIFKKKSIGGGQGDPGFKQSKWD